MTPALTSRALLGTMVSRRACEAKGPRADTTGEPSSAPPHRWLLLASRWGATTHVEGGQSSFGGTVGSKAVCSHVTVCVVAEKGERNRPCKHITRNSCNHIAFYFCTKGMKI